MLGSQIISPTPSPDGYRRFASQYARKRRDKRQADRERIHAQVVHPIDTPRLIRDPFERRQSRIISTIAAARLLIFALFFYILLILFFLVINRLIGEHSVYRPAQRVRVRLVKKPVSREEPPPIKTLQPLKGPIKPDFVQEKQKTKPPKKQRRKKSKRMAPTPQEGPDESSQAFEEPVIGLNSESTIPDSYGPTFAVGSTRMGTTQRTAADLRQSGSGTESGGRGKGLQERTPGPPQLSLWLDPQKIVQMVLISPVTTLLVSIPGYGDVLRGSQIRPFVNLKSLRVRLTTLASGRLVLAGQHSGGEQAILDAAQRVAAMRNQELVWRGDPALRATSWVDPSGADRGLAVHQGAFIIGPRTAMAALLKTDRPDKRVLRMSRLHARAYFALTIEDASRYLPGVDTCALQALRLSLKSNGRGTNRLDLTADYRSALYATGASACFRGLQQGGSQLSILANWLARAQGSSSGYTRKLQIGITSGDVEQLIDALSWSIRTARRVRSRSAVRP